LAPTDIARPHPLPTEVLVRVRAAGLNPVDVGISTGSSAEFLATTIRCRLGRFGGGGEIGAGVTRFAVGDAVFGMPWFPRPAGSFAQYVVAPSR